MGVPAAGGGWTRPTRRGAGDRTGAQWARRARPHPRRCRGCHRRAGRRRAGAPGGGRHRAVRRERPGLGAGVRELAVPGRAGVVARLAARGDPRSRLAGRPNHPHPGGRIRRAGRRHAARHRVRPATAVVDRGGAAVDPFRRTPAGPQRRPGPGVLALHGGRGDPAVRPGRRHRDRQRQRPGARDGCGLPPAGRAAPGVRRTPGARERPAGTGQSAAVAAHRPPRPAPERGRHGHAARRPAGPGRALRRGRPRQLAGLRRHRRTVRRG